MIKVYPILIVMIIMGSFDAMNQTTLQTDVQGNSYSWSSHELVKRNPQQEVLFTWQNPSGGSLKWIDVSDPFRILTYSKDLNKIIWLNNKLAPIGDPVYLSEINILEPNGMGVSKDGGLWIIDAATSKLTKVNKRLETEISAPLRIFESNTDNKWMQIAEWKQYLAILIPEKQLWIGDLFGQMIKIIPTDAKELKSSSEGLILISSVLKTIYQPETGQLKSLIKKP